MMNDERGLRSRTAAMNQAAFRFLQFIIHHSSFRISENWPLATSERHESHHQAERRPNADERAEDLESVDNTPAQVLVFVIDDRHHDRDDGGNQTHEEEVHRLWLPASSDVVRVERDEIVQQPGHDQECRAEFER
jgi:hypothetical protein